MYSKNIQFNALAKNEILAKISDQMHLQKIVFALITVSLCVILISNQFQNQENFTVQMNNSGPYIGTGVPFSYGYDGTGIIISVIDTGVDFNHPDIFGFGTDGKIIGGYDFVDILMVMEHK